VCVNMCESGSVPTSPKRRVSGGYGAREYAYIHSYVTLRSTQIFGGGSVVRVDLQICRFILR